LNNQNATWVLWAFFIAFAIKMPVFPFHTWQPDTYTAAPAQGTMLLSGIMLKMGIYGVMRWMLPMAPEALSANLPIFLALSVIGIVYASIIAIQRDDMKRLIAYSSIAHVGLIAAGVFSVNIEGFQGAMVQMLNHGINVIGLFFIAEIIEQRTGTRLLSKLGGIAAENRGFAILMMLVVLGAVAVPLSNGFVGELLLLNAVFKANAWLGATAGLTIILCAVYMLKLYGSTAFGETANPVKGFDALKAHEWTVLGIICTLILVLGIYPQPILDLTASAVNKLLLQIGG
jgi:NADH-quinone oxidoreductase subunit M